MTMARALQIVGLIAFILAVLGVPVAIALVPLGLACWLASEL
jgi:hypothetical protein